MEAVKRGGGGADEVKPRLDQEGFSQISSPGYNDCHYHDDRRSNGPKPLLTFKRHRSLRQGS